MASVCRACGSGNAGILFCEDCGALRPVSEAERHDKFSLFNLAPTADLSKKALESAYLKLSRRLHPDKFRHSDAEAAAARRLSALVNDAYVTLRDPVKRARYLIDRSGQDVVAKAEPAFLAEQLEYRERLETSEGETLLGLMHEIEVAYKASLEAVFNGLRSAEAGNSAYEPVAQDFVKLTYWGKLLQQAQEIKGTR